MTTVAVGISLAWFRRNKFRLHPSHDFVAGPSRSRGHGRPRHPNLPYRHFRAHAIAFCYHFPDIMSNSYRSKLSIYESLSSITEPFEVIVILDLTEYSLRLNRSPASMHQALITSQQFSGHSSQLIITVVDLYSSGSALAFVAHAPEWAVGAVLSLIKAFGGCISKIAGLFFSSNKLETLSHRAHIEV